MTNLRRLQWLTFAAAALAVAPSALATKPTVSAMVAMRKAPSVSKAEEKKEYTSVASAIHKEHIIPFMLDAAKDGYVKTPKGGKVSLATLRPVWSNKFDSGRIEDKFRAAYPNAHEMVPSDRMLEVMTVANKSKDMRWIYLQHNFRVPTVSVIFNPAMTPDPKDPKHPLQDGQGHILLQGHSGALYFTGNGTQNPATVYQAQFHDELRKAFEGSRDPVDCAKALKKIYAKWVWNGSALSAPVSSRSHYKNHKNPADGPNFRSSKLQAQRYKSAMAGFDKVIADMQHMPEAKIEEALEKSIKPVYN